MLQQGTFFLFSLERYDRQTQTVRTIACVIIAAETPLYIGRLSLSADTVEDFSRLIVATGQAHDVLVQLERIKDAPGTEMTRDHGELFITFDDPTMTERGTTVVFNRAGYRTSFVRKTDRYEAELRQFVIDHPH